MTRILTAPERIKLLREINRVHKETYGWGMPYWNTWGRAYFIDLERDLRATSDDWVPLDGSEVEKYLFLDEKCGDITSLRGIFSWEASSFYHLNPYKFDRSRIRAEDIISDGLGKRPRPDIDYPIKCRETPITVQQRKDDGKIWVSSAWQYHMDCYVTTSPFGEAIHDAINQVTWGDGKAYDALAQRYEELTKAKSEEFRSAIDAYFCGGRLDSVCWDRGYVFAPSKEWRIKNTHELNGALEAEDRHSRLSFEEFLNWLRGCGVSLGEKAEEFLRMRLREIYLGFPWGAARDLGEELVREDRVRPSDVFMWWGGEPNNDCCYAFLTLFFEIDPEDIGTKRFDERVSRNLRTIIEIAEKGHAWLSFWREYEPYIWRAIFSQVAGRP
jgi:hypothetical protein